MIVPSYEYYTEHGGQLTEEQFQQMLGKACYCVDNATFGHYDKCTLENTTLTVVQRIRDCLCAVVDYLDTQIEEGGYSYKAVTSEKVGSWSCTYDSRGISPNMMYYIRTQIVGLYLDTTNLMCRWA